MSTATTTPTSTKHQPLKAPPQYECDALLFAGDPNASFERHLGLGHAIDPVTAGKRERFSALARSVRDLLTRRWLKTEKHYDDANPKRVYYLSMEWLIGRSLGNNIINLGIEPLVSEAMKQYRLNWQQLAELEADAGLGNGGLGRLAACFIESMATLQVPAMGYGLRYQYGIFRQDIRDGYQVEAPDHWLRRHDPWEQVRRGDQVPVQLACPIEIVNGSLRPGSGVGSTILGVPYDRPVVGYGGRNINTLRLWDASTPDAFDFGEFSSGDFVGAVGARIAVETLTRVLYPDDSTRAGRALRFAQEHFLVACSVGDIVERFRRNGNDWTALPDKVAIQLNDTHPAMAVSELMRILLDRAGLSWDVAWDLTRRTLAYTNHTILPEALEKWQVPFFESLIPRHLEIIYEINRRFLDEVRAHYPDEPERLRRMSLIEEGPEKRVRMANLAIVGSHSTNGVAAIHSELLKKTVVRDFAEMYPERFNNKTNGVTPRRWLLLSNPFLAKLITEAIGDGWPADLSQLRRLLPLADDAAFRGAFRQAKRQAKARFCDWLRTTTGQNLSPDTIFDCQVKRIHEYKRQLLNVLHVLILYNRLRAAPRLEVPPRTFIFGGKAAPAYALAKLIIKLINSVAAVVDADAGVRDRMHVVFVPNYNVSLAERLIPAADVSEQISTAGYEASGTGNMKFMMNGALTVGTRDGATIEMAEEAGEENFFLFGLTAEQVQGSRFWYNPRWHYEHEPETRAALDLIFSGALSPGLPLLFEPLRKVLLEGDYYMHLADLTAYAKTQGQVGDLYGKPEEWTRKAIINVACSGKFSSDRSINDYCADIWGATPCPVP
jgi:starch phosphorylase